MRINDFKVLITDRLKDLEPAYADIHIFENNEWMKIELDLNEYPSIVTGMMDIYPNATMFIKFKNGIELGLSPCLARDDNGEEEGYHTLYLCIIDKGDKVFTIEEMEKLVLANKFIPETYIATPPPNFNYNDKYGSALRLMRLGDMYGDLKFNEYLKDVSKYLDAINKDKIYNPVLHFTLNGTSTKTTVHVFKKDGVVSYRILMF